MSGVLGYMAAALLFAGVYGLGVWLTGCLSESLGYRGDRVDCHAFAWPVFLPLLVVPGAVKAVRAVAAELYDIVRAK